MICVHQQRDAYNDFVNFEICRSKDLFRSKKFLDFDTLALSFLFDKHCSIME